jgi:hypothetical protein
MTISNDGNDALFRISVPVAPVTVAVDETRPEVHFEDLAVTTMKSTFEIDFVRH